MLWLYRFFMGYLLLEFKGEFPERIINLCSKEHISIWGLKYKKNAIRGYMSISDFRMLIKIRKGIKIRAHIVKKYGMPFLRQKYKQRIGLILGGIMFLLLLNLMSCFIWNISVKGNSDVKAEEIFNLCEEIGIHRGMSKKDFSAKDKRDELLLKTDKLAWASLNIEGCFLEIEVSEIEAKSHSDEPVNLKSSADGIIKKVDVKTGNCVVKVGDTVRTGDLLVSGIIESAFETEFVHSSGEIIAQTERSFTAEGKFHQTKIIKTGKIAKRSVLDFLGLKVPLYISSVKGDYITETKEKQAFLFNKPLPFLVTEKSFVYISKRQVELSEKKLEEQLRKNIENQILSEGIKEYEIKQQDIEKTENSLKLNVIINSEENIAIEDILLINSGN